jgi:hypothetical protein
MQKRFRAWDGQQYWYADEHLRFINNYQIEDLRSAPFELKDVDMFINKTDPKGQMIYENDVIKDQNSGKLYQVIWSNDECGFRKIPYGMSFPETKINEAFVEVIGTINSEKK